MNINSGDILFQIFMFILILGMMYFIFRVVTKTLSKNGASQKSNPMEEKLDRIIELLEKDRKS